MRRVAVLAIWIAALVVTVQRHEMWRDELQAWSIAAPATSLADLWHRAAYEPDPNLWFVVLFAASRISSAPFVVQIVNVLIATGAAALVLFRAPFPPWLRVLLAFSYMMFFEWGVISRPYALVVLLTLSCAEAVRRKASVVTLALLLFLLMTVSMYGSLFAFGFAALLSWRCWNERDVPLLPRVAAMAIVGAGVACVAATLKRPSDAAFPPDAHDAVRTLASVMEGLTPLVPLRRDFWDVAVLPLPLAAVIGAILLATAVMTLRAKLARALFVSGAGALLAVTYFVSNGAWRHHGLLLIAYVAALWATSAAGRATYAFLAAILVIQCLSSVAAVADDWRYDFSAGARAARFIEQKGWSNALLIGYPDHITSTVAGQLGRDFYFVNGGRFGRYVVWDKRRFQTDLPALEATIARARRKGQTVIAIAGSGRKFQWPGFELVGTFGPATVPTESYRIYLVLTNGQSVGP